MSAATRSGLLFGIFAFFSNLGLGVLFPLCTPACAVVWGIGAGVATVAWSDPAGAQGTPTRNGAFAGLLAGIGALLGVVIGVVLQYTVLGGQQLAVDLAQEFSRDYGLSSPEGEFFRTAQWVGVFLITCCLSVFNLAIMAAAGAGGAALYASRSGGTSQESVV